MELITLKSPREQEAMRRAGRLAAQARALAGSMVRPGVTTKEIDDAVRRFIRSHGGQPPGPAHGLLLPGRFQRDQLHTLKYREPP